MPVHPVPLLHRWVAGAGVLLGAVWLITAPLAIDLRDQNDALEPLLAGHALLPLVGLLFVLLGLVCELILGAAFVAEERRHDGERIDELSGRIRFRRTKRKVKIIGDPPLGWRSSHGLARIAPLPRTRMRTRPLRESRPESW